MGKTNTNFIAGKMNKSVDERLLPPGEYIDAENVRLGSTENTEIGAVENSLGNTILTDLQFAGEPLTGDIRCIGVYEDGMSETLYWFVHNENNPFSTTTGVVDLIVSYSTNTGSLTYHVVSTSVLNFDFKYLITGVSKIEDLLFFTDDLNPPRGINVKRDYAYPGPGQIDDVFEEEDVSVIVKPPGFEDVILDNAGLPITPVPLGSPYVKLIALPSTENYMETRFLSFAYRYRYEDGQYSATSLFSTPAFEPQPFQLSIQNYWNAGMKNRYNAADVTFSTGSRRVVEVDLLYKQTTSNVIYVIKRYKKSNEGWGNNEFRKVQFTNAEIYTTLGSDELLRLYDNVPRIAKAQVIKGNRLTYGNYVDGYDMRITEGGPLIQLDYRAEPSSATIAGVELGGDTTNINPQGSPGVYSIGGAHTEPDSILTWDLAAVQPTVGPIGAGTTITFNFAIQQTTTTVCTDVGGSAQCANTSNQSSPFNVGFSFTCPIDYVDVNTMLSSQTFKDRIGGSIAQGFSPPFVVQDLYACNNSAAGGTLSDKFYSQSESPMTGSTLYLVSGGVNNAACSPASLISNPFPAACSSSILLDGTTLCDAGQPSPPLAVCTAGQMTVDGFDFGSMTLPLAVGNIVTDQITGLTASVAAVPVVGDDFVLLTDIDGGLVTLETNGTIFQITSGSSSIVPCSPDGFEYTNTGTQFSIQIPATEYFSGDPAGAAGVYSQAYRYYNFIPFSCTAAFLLDDNSGSLHSNRDYETGIVYMDDFGRASTVLTSNECTTYFEPVTSVYKNKIRVTLDSLPPYWATKYKWVVKPSQGTYQTVYSNIFYQQDGTATSPGGGLPIAESNDPSQVWFKLDGQNQNILKVGDELYVKQDTQGPIESEAKSVVLAIQAFSGKAITNTSLTGLYMLLKPSGWSIEIPDDVFYFRGKKEKKNESGGSTTGSCINDYNLNDSSGIPYTIPVGSTIKISGKSWRGGSKCSKSLTYSRTFTSTADYGSFHQWAIGDDLQSQMTTTGPGTSGVNGMSISFNNTLHTSTSAACASGQYSIECSIRTNGTGQFFVWNGALKECSEVGWSDTGYFPGRARLTIEVTRAGGVFVFETEPQEVDPNLFYDASDLLAIEPEIPGGQKYHLTKRNFVPDSATPLGYYSIPKGGQDQDSTGLPMVCELDAYNCYTFGNGVESFRIYDSPGGKTFNLGERVLAVSNQDFQEADRFAGMTYSGVYSSSANSNNLNEFNLGLLNFKDCETSFGPIQKMHARETDILVLQEDRISYVLVSKNVISDSTGGGAIASVPQVLGTQIARIEEFGISFNPESFSSWGYDMFFTDTKRGAVINLRGSGQGNDQLQVVSSYGMNSWFRSSFNAQLTTQKLGGYDPYMKEYVLGTNSRSVPVPPNEVPCGTTITQLNSTQVITYEVDLGVVIGTVDIPYTVNTGGNVSISIEWNGSVAASIAGATTNGSLSFMKSLNSPDTATVTLTPSVASTYSVTVECPPEIPLTVIQVVTNTNNYNGEFIHTSYNWTDGVNISPYTGFSSAGLVTVQASEYQSNVGVRSVGVFPYSGTDIKLRTQKFGIDTFDFNPAIHKFRILSSNTLYSNTAVDLQALLTASTIVGGGVITNPSVGEYQSIEPAFNMPIGNQYLYLIWDLRLIGSMNICYCSSPSTASEVCCDCTVICNTAFFGPYNGSTAAACSTDVDSPGALGIQGFYGNGSIPSIGDVCYADQTCSIGSGSASAFTPEGFYIVSSSATGPTVPKKWVEINNVGNVIAEGFC